MYKTVMILLILVCLSLGCTKVEEPNPELDSRMNMKFICIALLETYEETQEWPESLDDFVTDKTLLNNPLTGDKIGYQYIKPTEPLEDIDAENTIVLYQISNGNPDEKLAVAYLDGRVPEIAK